MCGRFTQTKEVELLRQRFGISEVRVAGGPAFNLAPTDAVPAVLAPNAGRTLDAMRWGLVPPWAGDLRQQPQPINARSETIGSSRLFRRLIPSQRCLVLADSFFEWGGPKGKRQPYRIRLKADEPFALAGLWDLWRDPGNPAVEIKSCTVLTTSANALLEPLHERMPVILSPEQEAAWLDPSIGALEPLVPLFAPYPAERMELYPVSAAVNDARHKGPECIAPLAQRLLFG